MGVNDRGLFVGLTNRPIEERREGCRSRGLLVQDALRASSARDVARELRNGMKEDYNPFNLLYADRRRAFLSRLGEDGLSTRALAPGLHVLCNRDVDDPDVPKVARIQQRVAALDAHAPFERLAEGLRAVLREHGEEGRPLEHVCVHTPGYGTRSSTLLALGPAGGTYRHAPGPLCQTKYEDYTRLLDGIRQAER
jgi:uncharacterized protein with NRDE domain